MRSLQTSVSCFVSSSIEQLGELAYKLCLPLTNWSGKERKHCAEQSVSLQE